MSNYDFEKKYTIYLNEKEATIIYNFLTVKSYDRLYDKYKIFKEDVKRENFSRLGGGEKLHFSDKINILNEEDIIMNDIVKNQLALGLLLERYVEQVPAQKLDSEKKFVLNSTLIYEFYITISEHIIKYDYVINNTDDSKVDREKAMLNKKLLENLSNKIYEAVGLKDLTIIKIDYKDLTIAQHLDACLK